MPLEKEKLQTKSEDKLHEFLYDEYSILQPPFPNPQGQNSYTPTIPFQSLEI